MCHIDEQKIKDRLTKSCPCRVVTRAVIKEAIINGADTLEKIRVATGAMTGSCRGKRCQSSIESLLASYDSETQSFL
ncbi:MAG: (2Fe-2S)-binding protein [Cellulosilyticaceae bacterium]